MPRTTRLILLAPALVLIGQLSGCATGHSVALVPSTRQIACADDSVLQPLPIPITGTAVLHYLVLPFGYASHDDSDRPLVVVLDYRSRHGEATLPPETVSIKLPEASAWSVADAIESNVTYRHGDWSWVKYSATFPVKRNFVSGFDVKVSEALRGCGPAAFRYEKRSGMFTHSELGR